MKQEWKNDAGQLHREDGPAVINTDSNRSWYINGYINGLSHYREEWFINGLLHRLDGPAVVDTDGQDEWWINGNEITYTIYSWTKKQNIPYKFDQWTDVHRVLFRLSF